MDGTSGFQILDSCIAKVLGLANEVCFATSNEVHEFFSGFWVGIDASLLKMSSQKLRGNSTKHDEGEHEQNCNIQKDGQGGHNGSYQGRHVGDLIDRSEGTKDTDNLNGLDTTTSHELSGPTKDNDGEIHLWVKIRNKIT